MRGALRDDRCRTRFAGRRYDGTCEDLFFYVERLIVAGRRADVGRAPAHRPQPQRHRHDDVPDAAAGDRARPAGGDAGAARRRCSASPAAHRDTIFPAHTHTQPAQPTTLAHYLLGGDRAARARRACGCARRSRRPIAVRSAPARSPAPGFRSIAQRTSDLLGFDGADRQHLRQHRDGRLSAREPVRRRR